MNRIFWSLLLTVLIPGMAAAQSLPLGSDVLILDVEDSLPGNLKHIGNIKIADGGFKLKCGYEHTMEEARSKARSKGANIVKITSLKKPDGLSTCYRLRADIYFREDIETLLSARSAAADAAVRAILPDTASYALLFVYRPRSGVGGLVQYNLHVGDSVVCRVKNGGNYRIKLYNNGETKIWARTEAREEFTADIQPGKAYFVRCGVSMGAFVGHPQLQLVDPVEGLKEFGPVGDEGE